jgi:WD40 repeat protein
LASGTADGSVYLWSVATRAEQMIISGHASGVHSCVFSPDGTLLATASVDRTVRLWRVADGAEDTVLSGHTSWPDRCAFSPDGTLLATVSNDQTIRLWDIGTGLSHCALRTAGPLTWVAWHPSGTMLSAVGGRGTYMFTYLP